MCAGRSSRSCPSRATTPRRWSTTTTGPRRCRRSTSCATSASTSRSTGCWRATRSKRRLESGISYTEFSYVLLQSMDFLNLYREHGVDAAVRRLRPVGQHHRRRRADPARRRGSTRTRFATPLITKADGTKYGKTEGGALWLDPEMLSPYAFHQFWLNVEDEKVGELLRIFTFLTREEIEDLEAADGGEAVPARRPEAAGRRGHRAGPRRRGGRAGQGRRGRAVRRGRPGRASSPTRSAPRCARPAVRRCQRGELPGIVDLLVAAGLAKSKGEARRTVDRGRRLPQQRAGRGPRAAARPRPTWSAGSWLVLRRGKKNFAGVEVA